MRTKIRQREEELGVDLKMYNRKHGKTMENNSEYAKPFLTGTKSSIVRPNIATNNFEIKPNIFQMVQQFV